MNSQHNFRGVGNIELRDYQQHDYKSLVELLAKRRPDRSHRCPRIVYQAWCGSGKTEVFGCMARNHVSDNGNRALIATASQEIIDQIRDRLLRHWGVRSGLVQGNTHDIKPVTVASLPTLAKRPNFPYRDFSLAVVDEMHHMGAPTFRALLPKTEHAPLLGVSATPTHYESDLREDWDSVWNGPSEQWLIDNGYLVPWDLVALPEEELDDLYHRVTGKHLTKRKVTDSDEIYHRRVSREWGHFSECLKKSEKARGSDCIVLGSTIELWRKYANGKRTVACCPTVDQARKASELFQEHGISSRYTYSDDPNRAEVIAAFRRGEFHVLCQCNLVNEGVDIPEIECVLLIKHFTLAGALLQFLMRACRPCEATGKERAVVIDQSMSCLSVGITPSGDHRIPLGGGQRKVIRTRYVARRTTDRQFFLDVDPRLIQAYPELRYVLIPGHRVVRNCLVDLRGNDMETLLRAAANTDSPHRTLAQLAVQMGCPTAEIRAQVDAWLAQFKY